MGILGLQMGFSGYYSPSYLVNYKHVEGQAYDFVVMDNGKRISISEDRRKLIGEQYCSMEDTFYVNE